MFELKFLKVCPLLVFVLIVQFPWQLPIEVHGSNEFVELMREIRDEIPSDIGQYVQQDTCRRSLADVLEWLNETMIIAETKLIKLSEADFESAINITDYNSAKAIESGIEYSDWFLGVTRLASDYLKKHDHWLSICGGPWKRMLEKLCWGGVLISEDSNKRKQVLQVVTDMETRYSTSEVVRNGQRYRLDPELENIMSDSRDFRALLWAWKSWHDLAKDSKNNFTDLVKLSNEAATEHGLKDTGEIWRIDDLEDPEADKIMVKLMSEIQPLYNQLHAYVRAKLIENYAPQVKGTPFENILDPEGPIPAHLFGNMWAQSWTSLADIMTPFPHAPQSPNVTKALLNQNYTIEKMFKLSEEFFVSLGFKPMTEIFWNKSVIRRPSDSNIKMVCHASAYDMIRKDDYRIKMCTKINEEDFTTIHHEMGHIEYYMEYSKQPFVFRDGGNSAFHEAVGDTIALSVMTPNHLGAIGLAQEINNSEGLSARRSNDVKSLIEQLEEIIDEEYHCDANCQTNINNLMVTALQKVVLLPFALALELWRYQVFSGDVTPDDYNDKWWELRRKYQGIVPPVKRHSNKFDPGAKFHVVANVPYARYFFSFIIQFQFHEALCRESGHHGQLTNCDIYKSKNAGNKLRSMLRQGSSKPWQDLMRDMTGTGNISANAILDYFKPLHKWLVKENRGRKIGWE